MRAGGNQTAEPQETAVSAVLLFIRDLLTHYVTVWEQRDQFFKRLAAAVIVQVVIEVNIRNSTV